MVAYPGTVESEIWTVNTGAKASISVRWNTMGSEFSYFVMYAMNPNGPWLRAHDYRLTDASQGIYPYPDTLYNEFTVSDLLPNTLYSFKILCLDRHDAWWYSFEEAGSIGGGLGSLYSRPTPTDGNLLGLQFLVNI